MPDYYIEVRTITFEIKYNIFLTFWWVKQGLPEQIKDELASQELLDELNAVIDLTIHTDCHMRERFMERLQSAVPLPNPQSTSLPTQTSAPYLVLIGLQGSWAQAGGDGLFLNTDSTIWRISANTVFRMTMEMYW